MYSSGRVFQFVFSGSLLLVMLPNSLLLLVSLLPTAPADEGSCDAACSKLGGSKGRPKMNEFFWGFRASLDCDINDGEIDSCTLQPVTPLTEEEQSACGYNRAVVSFRHGGFGERAGKVQTYTVEGKEYFTVGELVEIIAKFEAYARALPETRWNGGVDLTNTLFEGLIGEGTPKRPFSATWEREAVVQGAEVPTSAGAATQSGR